MGWKYKRPCKPGDILKKLNPVNGSVQLCCLVLSEGTKSRKGGEEFQYDLWIMSSTLYWQPKNTKVTEWINMKGLHAGWYKVERLSNDET